MRETTENATYGRNQAPSQSSIGGMLTAIARDTSALVRQEIELARAELRQEAREAGKAAGMFAGAAIGGFMVLLFLSYALWWGLSNVMDQGWAALIVAVIWAVIAGVLAMLGRRWSRGLSGLPQTSRTVRRIPDALANRTQQPSEDNQ